MSKLNWWNAVGARVTCFDNEGGTATADAGDDIKVEGNAGDGDAGATGDASGTTQDPPEKTFTQDQVNDIVAKRNKAVKAQLQTMESNYENLLKQQNLTKEQRDGLESSLEAVRMEMLTEKEKLEREKKKAQEKYDTDLGEAHKQRDYYKGLFEESTIQRAIKDAAGKDAYNSDHFVSLLGPKSQIVEETDSTGEKTGRLVPKIEWEVKDPDTGEVVKGLRDPQEVVDLMKEDVERFGNLFVNNIARGVGGGQAEGAVPQTPGSIDPTKLSTAEYMKLAKTEDGRRALGLIR